MINFLDMEDDVLGYIFRHIKDVNTYKALMCTSKILNEIGMEKIDKLWARAKCCNLVECNYLLAIKKALNKFGKRYKPLVSTFVIKMTKYKKYKQLNYMIKNWIKYFDPYIALRSLDIKIIKLFQNSLKKLPYEKTFMYRVCKYGSKELVEYICETYKPEMSSINLYHTIKSGNFDKFKFVYEQLNKSLSGRIIYDIVNYDIVNYDYPNILEYAIQNCKLGDFEWFDAMKSSIKNKFLVNVKILCKYHKYNKRDINHLKSYATPEIIEFLNTL